MGSGALINDGVHCEGEKSVGARAFNARPHGNQNSRESRTTRLPAGARASRGHAVEFGSNDGRLFEGELDVRTSYNVDNAYNYAVFHAQRYRCKAPSACTKQLLFFIPTRLRPLNFLPVLLLKRPHRHLIQSQQSLVGILYQDVLAIFHIPAHIDDGPDDTPAISEVEVHLLGEFARIVTDDPEDDMSIGDFGGSSGYETVAKG